MVALVPFKDDFAYKPQKRKDSATALLTRRQVGAADFETKNGYPWIYSWTQYNSTTDELEDNHIHFSGTVDDPDMFSELNMKMFGSKGHVFSVKAMVAIHYQSSHLSWKQGRKGKDGKKRTKKGKRIPMMWFYNLKYDASSVIKTLPDAIIQELMNNNKVIIDTTDWSVAHLDYEKGRYTTEDGDKIGFNRYIKLTYLPKKWLQIDPIMHYTKGIKWGKLDCWDIMQFFGRGSLNYNSEKYLGDSKLDFTRQEMALMGSHSAASTRFCVKHKAKLIEYAEKDSNLTQRLAWLRITDFESNGVRMCKPYSEASVAERACYDSSKIPTMNNMMEHHDSAVKAAWTAYQGGWFESVGAGTHDNIKAYDITSAYPHIMWWMVDLTDGVWIGSFYDDTEAEMKKYLKSHIHHNPAFFEALIEFPTDKPLYPAAKMSPTKGCLVNARVVVGWFTGDEIKEFEKWGAVIGIERWCAFKPNTENEEADDVQGGIRYPFRPFITTFYNMKLEQDLLKAAKDPAYDPAKRQTAKTMLCSIYGKTCQAIEQYLEDKRQTGAMWSSVYSALITGGTRARLGEFIRVNGYENTLSVQTDGIILKGDTHTVPANHTPVIMNGNLVNLGDWEDDGEGTLVLLMSGVYTVINTKTNKVKTTYRGNYALFIDNAATKPADIRYGKDWAQFLKLHDTDSKVERTATVNAYSRPFSLGEARVRKDFSLVNQFRVINTGIKANGDSNKRNWQHATTPNTFGDLATGWFASSPWELLL